jgi:hypothetical protein
MLNRLLQVHVNKRAAVPLSYNCMLRLTMLLLLLFGSCRLRKLWRLRWWRYQACFAE